MLPLHRRVWICLLASWLAMPLANAATEWTAETHSLSLADFNDDSIPDFLVIAKDAWRDSGIAFGDGQGGYNDTLIYTFVSNHLGIDWANDGYEPLILSLDNPYCLPSGGCNCDNQYFDDVLLRGSAADPHHIVVTGSDAVVDLNVLLDSFAGPRIGIDWSTEASRVLAGKFNAADRYDDVFVQPTLAGEAFHVVQGSTVSPKLDDPTKVIVQAQNGQGVPGGDGLLGYDWSVEDALVHVGNFDGDQIDDLLIQGRTSSNKFGVVIAAEDDLVFDDDYVSWVIDAIVPDWSADNYVLHVGNFDGDAYDDVLLQPVSGTGEVYIVLFKALGPAGSETSTFVDISFPYNADGMDYSTTSAVLHVADFDNDGKADIYYQARAIGGTNRRVIVDLAATDEDIVTPVAVDEPALSETAVGSTPGDFVVTGNGSASYRIPIKVAKGANGLSPKIALTYNSQQGSGLAAMGWTLSGLSRIMRCNRRFGSDNYTAAGVRFTAEDRFCLDGQRLVQVAGGAYGSDGAEYRPQVHDYQKVHSYGMVGSGPERFVVHLRNGLTLYFGGTDDSRIEAPNTGGEIRTWALSRIEDKYFNQILFNYDENQATGEYVPDEIEWTAHDASQTSQRSISGGRYRLEFDYEPLTPSAVREGYRWGTIWTHSKRLSKIRYVLIGSAAPFVHEYTLAYETPASNGTGQNRLDYIQQCGPADCLPPTTFDWTDGDPTHGVQGWLNDYAVNSAGVNYDGLTSDFGGDVYYIDFDGDGDQDIMTYGSGNWVLVEAKNSGYAAGLVDTTIPSFGVDTNNGRNLIGDVDGDGCQDFMSGGTGNTWHVFRSQCNGSTPGQFVDLFDTGIPTDISYVTAIGLADIDGDGLQDLVYASMANATTDCTGGSSMRCVYYRKNIGGGFGAEQKTSVEYDAVWLSNISGRDLDADGRDDLILGMGVVNFNRVSSGYVFHLSASDDFESTADWVSPAVQQLLFPDVNGDGLPDLLYREQDISGGWYLSINEGDEFRLRDSLGLTHSGGVIADFNGDGLDDWIRNHVGSQSGYRVHLSTGTGYDIDDSDYYVDLGGYPTYSLTDTFVRAVVATEVDADGYTDLLFHTEEYRHLARHHSPKADLLASVTDGLGNKFIPQYKPLSDSSVYVLDQLTGYFDNTELFLRHWVRGGMRYVVNSYQASDGVGGLYTVDYAYHNAQYDIRGIGFAGFARIRATDSRNGVHKDTFYRQVWPLSGRKRQEAVVQPGATEQLVSQTTTDWDIQYFGTTAEPNVSAHFLYWSDRTTDAYDLNTHAHVTQSIQSRAFDIDHGVPATVTDSQEDIATGQTWTSQAQLSQFDVGAKDLGWCLGLATQISLTNTAPDGTIESRTQEQSFSGTRCDKTWEIFHSTGTTPQLRRDFVYHPSYGGLTSLTEDNRRTDYIYDSDGYRVEQIKYLEDSIPDGGGGPPTETFYIATTHWDDRFGVKADETSIQGVTTAWSYDEFARITKVDNLNNAAHVDTEYSPYSCSSGCDYPTAAFVVRSKPAQAAADQWSSTYFDSVGRELGADTVLLDGGISRVQRVYDDQGRLDKETLPYRTDGTIVPWVDYSHDLLGRVLQETRPANELDLTGAVTQYAYSGLSITITDARSNSRTLAHNANGTLASVTEPVGTTYYAYTPFAELKTITDSEGNVSSFTYDRFGNTLTQTDPNSGTWLWEYNQFKQVTKQTDARSPAGTIDYSYDRLGRVETQIDSFGSTVTSTATFDYVDPDLNGASLIDSVSHNVGGTTIYMESFVYNTDGQVEQAYVNIDGEAYSTDTTYDNYGRPKDVTYPDTPDASTGRSKFLYHYTDETGSLLPATGHLYGVSQDIAGTPEPIYTVFDVGPAGRPTLAVFGNAGPYETVDYDAGHLRVSSIQTGTDLGAVDIQDYRYEWDAVGNFTRRQDLARSLDEVVGYDAVNRLDTVMLNGSQTLDVDYSPTGRITHKSDVGDYDYAGASGGPHAVAAITGGPRGTMAFVYDENGNLTSRAGDAITWTPFNKPSQITSGTDYSNFTYGPDRRRIIQGSQHASNAKTTHYIGKHFEAEYSAGDTRYRANIYFGSRVVYAKVDSASSLEEYYLHRDHQGSVDRLTPVGMPTGQPEGYEAFSFDAHGKRRNLNWSADSADQLLDDAQWTERGYTGHEHLDNVSLVHMNGRVQDPTIGLMSSPDPIRGMLTNPQTLNRYAYVANNPLSFTDPTGFQPCGLSDSDATDCWDETIVLAERDPTSIKQIFTSSEAIRRVNESVGDFVETLRFDAMAELNSYGDRWRSEIFDTWLNGDFVYRVGASGEEGEYLDAFSFDQGIVFVHGEVVLSQGGQGAGVLAARTAAAGAAEAGGSSGVLRGLLARAGGGVITFLASLLTGDTPQDPDFRHYTDDLGAAGIQSSGVIRPSSDGIVYVTPTLYRSGAEARQALELRQTPVGYFLVPRSRLPGLAPLPPTSGGGIQYGAPGPVNATGLDYIPIGP